MKLKSSKNQTWLISTWFSEGAYSQVQLRVIKDAAISGIDSKTTCISTMAIKSDTKYAVHDSIAQAIYEVDLENTTPPKLLTLGSHRLDDTCHIYVKGSMTVVIRCGYPILFSISGETAVIKSVGLFRNRKCKNDALITNRWSQQRGDMIYFVDSDDDLCYIRWREIERFNVTVKMTAFTQVEDFFAAENDEIAVIHLDGRLSLPMDKKIDLTKIKDNVGWSIVIKISSKWLVCGDANGKATLALIGESGRVNSVVSQTLTTNGYVAENSEYSVNTSMYCMKVVEQKKDRALVLAIERDCYCHLVAYYYPDNLVRLDTFSMISRSEVNMVKSEKVILSITKTNKDNEFIATGIHWVKIFTLKLK